MYFIHRFNTSYVVIKRVKDTAESTTEGLFQYILCCY